MRKALAAVVLVLVLLSGGCAGEIINVTIRRDAFRLLDVYAADSSHVWAVGTKGHILFNDGSGWREQDSGTDLDLRGVSGSSPENVWAVGNEGTILHYDGNAWRAEPRVLSNRLEDVAVADEGRIWAVGRNVTVDGEGGSWNVRASGWNLTAVCRGGEGRIWVAGDEGVALYDGEWSERFSSPVPLRDISVSPEGSVWAVGYGADGSPVYVSTVYSNLEGSWAPVHQIPDAQLETLSALDNENVWVMGAGKNARLENGVWSRFETTPYIVSFNTYYGVYALDPETVYAVGSELGGKLVSVPFISTFDGSAWSNYNPGF